MEFEIKIINWLQSILTPIIKTIFEFLTFLGGQEVLILVVLVMYFMYSKKAGQRIAFTVFGSLLVNNSMKGIINRARPFENPDANYEVDDFTKANSTGQSFPSGHSQNSAVTYTSIGLIYKKRRLWYIIALVILIVAFSRVALGVHYPSDVIIGVGLGIGFAFIGSNIHQKVEQNFKKQMQLYISVAIIFFPFLFIFWRKEFIEIEKYKDFYTVYAFYIGFIISVYLEYKYVNFDCKNNFNIKFIRTFLALFIVIIIQYGLKGLLPEENIIMDMFRYFLLSFIGIGVYPILTKKWLFNSVD